MSTVPPSATITAPTTQPPGRPPAGPGVVALRVLGAGLAVLLIAGATFGVVAQFFRQSRTATRVYPGVTAVSVSATTGAVTVRTGSPGGQVTVTRHLTWSFLAPTSVETVTGGRLDVRADCDSAVGLGLCSVGYDLVVPPDLPLTLETHTGTIEVDGVTGDLTASTSTGSVELRRIGSSRVEAHTSTGSVEVGFTAAPDDVRADTSTGSVEVVVPADGLAYAVSASTSTGSTEVRVPSDPASSHRISAHTSTGSVEVRTTSP